MNRLINQALLALCFGVSTTLNITAAGLPSESMPMLPDTLQYELNPIVVTGTTVHQRLKDTPVPVEVITANEIKNAGVNGLQEALTMMVPTLSFSPNAMGSYLRMNGMTNNHVLILVNGKRLVGDISGNVDLSQIDLSIIKRIEVLNGAASTLYGSEAVGGVINIITHDPNESAEFNTETRYSGHNQFDQALNMSLRSHNVGSLTSYRYSHSDGWQNSDLTLSGDELVPTLAQLSLGYTSNNFTQRFTWDPCERLKLHAEGAYYNKLLDRPVARTGIEGGSKYNNLYESFSWNGGAEYSLGTLGELTFDYSGRTFGQWYKYMLQVDDYLPGQLQKTKRQIYHDASLRGRFGFVTGGTTVIGADYRHETLVRPESDLDKGLATLSAYGQHEQRLFGHLTGILGLRYDHHETLGSRLTPKAALMFSAGDLNIRGTYAQGYRVPGIDELYYHMFKPMGSRYTITFGNPDLKAEESNYGSINAEYRTGHFSISATAYINHVKNMVTSRSTKFKDLDEASQAALIKEFPEINDIKTSSLSVKEYYNFAKADVKGIEANLTWNPAAGLVLSANYAYAYGRGLNDDGSWQRLNRSVLNTATFTANYTHYWDWYKMDINLNGRVQSKTYYPTDADGDAPGYGVWNLTTRHRFGCFRGFALTAGIGVNNLFNRKDMRPLNSNFALYSPGRELVVSLSVNIN